MTLTAADIRELADRWADVLDNGPRGPIDLLYTFADHLEKDIVLDVSCKTCGGTGWSAQPKRRTADELELLPCPDCTDGRVPYIAIAKQGGQWPDRLIEAMTEGDLKVDGPPTLADVVYARSVLDALAETSGEGE